MKQKDMMVIVLAIFISGIFSFIVASMLIFGPKTRNATVEKVNPITAEFTLPSEAYFNANAVNPTKLIEIGGNDNPQPFDDAKASN